MLALCLKRAGTCCAQLQTMHGHMWLSYSRNTPAVQAEPKASSPPVHLPNEHQMLSQPAHVMMRKHRHQHQLDQPYLAEQSPHAQTIQLLTQARRLLTPSAICLGHLGAVAQHWNRCPEGYRSMTHTHVSVCREAKHTLFTPCVEYHAQQLPRAHPQQMFHPHAHQPIVCRAQQVVLRPAHTLYARQLQHHQQQLHSGFGLP